MVATTGALVFVGCSIGALEGFSGGPADADASTSADGSTPSDAASATDAPADAPFDSSALDCDGGAYLVCATFDQGAIAAGWTSTELRAGGVLGLSNDARSAPYAMRAQLPPMTTEENQYARVWVKWPATLALRISFDLKIATPASAGEAFSVAHLLFPSTANETYLFRANDETTLSIEQNPPASRYQKLEDLPYDRWLRVTLEVVPTSPVGTLRLRYDGRSVYENDAVPFQAPTAPETYVFVGLARFQPTGPALEALYDNVTIEQIP